jgi:hypothetical protein
MPSRIVVEFFDEIVADLQSAHDRLKDTNGTSISNGSA